MPPIPLQPPRPGGGVVSGVLVVLWKKKEEAVESVKFDILTGGGSHKKKVKFDCLLVALCGAVIFLERKFAINFGRQS